MFGKLGTSYVVLSLFDLPTFLSNWSLSNFLVRAMFKYSNQRKLFQTRIIRAESYLEKTTSGSSFKSFKTILKPGLKPDKSNSSIFIDDVIVENTCKTNSSFVTRFNSFGKSNRPSGYDFRWRSLNDSQRDSTLHTDQHLCTINQCFIKAKRVSALGSPSAIVMVY